MIREPAVAGMFYPANPSTLRRELGLMVPSNRARIEAAAVVVPHAGYMYSGGVAGLVYGSVVLPSRYILLGPNHTGRGERLSLHPDGEWRSPLGPAKIDSWLNARLLEEFRALTPDARAHGREHSLEVQIPFLQAAGTGFTFSAICVGTTERSLLVELGRALARVIRSSDTPVMMVASSDMNHFEPAAVAEPKDRAAIACVEAIDPEGLYRTVLEKDVSMCGIAPTMAVLTACRELGCTRGQLIRYSNSGEISGDYDSVVGYAGMAILSPAAAGSSLSA
jgi:MEMO1 family protein